MSPLWGVLDSDMGQIWPHHEKLFWLSDKQTIWNKCTGFKIFKNIFNVYGEVKIQSDLLLALYESVST